MVKEQIPAFILNRGARTEPTQMRLSPYEGYIMSSHYPLEEQNPRWLPALHGHFQLLDHACRCLARLPPQFTGQPYSHCLFSRPYTFHFSKHFLDTYHQAKPCGHELVTNAAIRQCWCACYHRQHPQFANPHQVTWPIVSRSLALTCLSVERTRRQYSSDQSHPNLPQS